MKPKLLLLFTLFGASMLTSCCDTAYNSTCETSSCYRPRCVDQSCDPPATMPYGCWYPGEQRYIY